jgi:hypothetical protein
MACVIIIVHSIIIVLFVIACGIVGVKFKLIVMCLPPSPFLCTYWLIAMPTTFATIASAVIVIASIVAIVDVLKE